jgi:predicted DNA-binding protein (MmcQ/YjbR family)
MARTSNAKKIRASLRELALTYPGAHEDFPWGESVIKVQGKVFVFLGVEKDAGASFCVKLPHSGDIALSLPFFKPAGYGLGKSGWVQAKLADDDALPPDLLSEWLDESYRAVAPKKLSATLKPAGAAPAPVTKAPAKAKITAKTKSVAKPKIVAKATIAAKPKAATKAKSRA